MTPSQMLKRFRSELRDEAEPYLWSDDDFYFYLDKALNDFVRGLDGIADSTSALTRIPLVPGVSIYPLSDKILKVKTVVREHGCALERVSDENEQVFRDSFNSVGVVRKFVLGADDRSIRVTPTPDSSEQGNFLRLTVLRLPRETMCKSCPEIELPSHLHADLLTGVYAQAHLKQDAETYDAARAREYNGLFTQAVDRAKRELGRRRHSPRAVRYGGI